MMTNLMTILERKAFISSNPRIVLSSCPPPCGHFSIQESASGGLSYKSKIPRWFPNEACDACRLTKYLLLHLFFLSLLQRERKKNKGSVADANIREQKFFLDFLRNRRPLRNNAQKIIFDFLFTWLAAHQKIIRADMEDAGQFNQLLK